MLTVDFYALYILIHQIGAAI